MSVTAGPDVLATIVAATRRTVAIRREREPIDELMERAATRSPRGDHFVAALARQARLNVIAECKRRSPSRGLLRPDYDPESLAVAYAAGGAAAISVLTEPCFFDGAVEHLSAVRRRVDLPLLRKDFIVDDYQLVEARAAGADAVLLIAAALDSTTLPALLARATTLGLAALVEVHDRDELMLALRADAGLVGVNNRSLRTLGVDGQVSLALIDLIPDGVMAVAESGLRSNGDLCRLRDAGYDAFLVGEALSAATDPARALADLLGSA